MAPLNPFSASRDNAPPKASQAEMECTAKGGAWDPTTNTCVLPQVEEKPPETAKVTTPEEIRDEETGEVKGVTLPDGRTVFASPKELRNLTANVTEKTAPIEGTVAGGTAQRAAEQAALGQQLAGQVGQIDPSTGLTPTNLSQTDAFANSVVGSIPGAIRLAGQFGAGAAVLGGVATAPAGGVGAVPAAAIGAATGFIAGIVGGMTNEMKGQRTDNTNAQQRVLDEGKQTLMDWVTLSKADPSNATFYLSQFNQQLQLIQNAHVQMITDTNADVAKFENAIPNLAEFSTFYSVGGERDALLNEMVNALQTPSSVEYSTLELADRRRT